VGLTPPSGTALSGKNEWGIGGVTSSDASFKAKAKLGWQPEVSFGKLIEMMVEADLKSLKV